MYLIFLDLLFTKNRHDQILPMYQKISERLQAIGSPTPKYLATIAFGSCYKLNTKGSFDFALNLLKKQRSTNQAITLRSTCFIAALAIEQNAPEIGLELICNAGHQQYAIIRNIKALAYAKLKRFEDSYQELKSILQDFNATQDNQNLKVYSDVVGLFFETHI